MCPACELRRYLSSQLISPKQISLAYEILQDEAKRAEYDEILEFLANNPSPSGMAATGSSRFWSQARQQQQQMPREAPSTPWYQHTFDELRAWAQAQHDKRQRAEEERAGEAERKREAEVRRREEESSWQQEQARMEDRRKEVEELRLEVEGTRVRDEEGWQMVEEDEKGKGYVLREEELCGGTGQWGKEEEEEWTGG